MIGAGDLPLLDSILLDLAVIGAISTFAFMFTIFRSGRAATAPVWWWLASAGILAIVAFVGTGISWGRGLAVILAGVALGNGLHGLYEKWKRGELRLRSERPPSEGDYAQAGDWFDPPIHVVGLTAFDRSGLDQHSPYFDFSVTIINGSVFNADLDPEIRGRISVDGGGLHERPEFQKASQDHTTRNLGDGADWSVRRNVPITIRLRQHVLPPVAEKLKAGNASVGFDGLDIAIRLIRSSGDGVERSGRYRVPITNALSFST